MEAEIKQRFTAKILDTIAQSFQISADQLVELDGFESFIYSFESQKKPLILRVSHSLRRSEALIRGEVDWINYLVRGGVHAASVIPSQRGHLVEAVEDGFGESFLATVFERVPGKPAWEVGWSYPLYQTLGQTLGRMHRLTQGYQPSDPKAERPPWDHPSMLMDVNWLPVGETLIAEKYQQIVEWCRGLTKDPDEYGLIHFDAHAGNYFVDQKGQIHLFDFDDCHYSWFSNDIAIVLFYMVMGAEEPAAFTVNFLRQFIHGYQRENRFKADWLAQIPYFLKMREIDLYGVIHRSFDVERLDDPWCIHYMKNRKQKIEHDIPYIDLDFKSLADIF